MKNIKKILVLRTFPLFSYCSEHKSKLQKNDSPTSISQRLSNLEIVLRAVFESAENLKKRVQKLEQDNQELSKKNQQLDKWVQSLAQASYSQSQSILVFQKIISGLIMSQSQANGGMGQSCSSVNRQKSNLVGDSSNYFQPIGSDHSNYN